MEDGFVVICRDGECLHQNMEKLPHQDQDVQSQDDSRQYLSDIDSSVKGIRDALWLLNKFIHENPELAFQEYKAHKALTDFMRSRKDWKVTSSAYGLETAWVASYDSGKEGPVVSFNVEMDALPSLGHACGHNLIATASLAAGIATAQMMRLHKLPGKVLIFGTPGEEFNGVKGGKIRLLEAGAYKDVDISLISHPSTVNNSPLVRTMAFARLEVEYFGRAAPAAQTPWLGINALDALVIGYNAVSVLRQQTMPYDVIGVSITNGGDGPNVIHAYTAAHCVIRAKTAPQLKKLQEKVCACFRAGAEATGARVEIKVIQGYADHVPNRVLAASYTKYWKLLPDMPDPPMTNDIAWVKAGTDQGDISYALPSVNASFTIPPGSDGGGPHSPKFEESTGTTIAFARALRVGKSLAGTAVDVLRTPGLVDEIKKQWKRDMDSIHGRPVANRA